MVAWILLISVSVAGLVLSAASRTGNLAMSYTHFMLAAGVSVLFAILAVRKLVALHEAGAARTVIAADAARSMGYVWTWAALVIVATYGTGVLEWKEWPAHFFGIFGAAGASLAIAKALDGASDNDETLLKLARYLTIIQLAGMLLVIVGFLVGGQMTRFLVDRYSDGPAKNVMFFGAVAIAAISGAALKYVRRSA